MPDILTWIKIDYSRALSAAINLDYLKYISQIIYWKTIYQLCISNIDSYIDISDKIYTRIDFARVILRSEAKELLKFIEDLLETAYLVIFKYSANNTSS